MIREVLYQLWKDKFARIALVVLGLIYFALFAANFIAPYSKDFSDEFLIQYRDYLAKIKKIQKENNKKTIRYVRTKGIYRCNRARFIESYRHCRTEEARWQHQCHGTGT